VATVYDCRQRDEREAGLTAATRAVQSSRLVVFPTGTVYGIGCDAFDAHAVRSLVDAKSLGRTMPLSVLVGSWSTVDGLVLSVPKRARDLIEAFWPGELSLVLPHAPSLAWDLGDTRGTVMVRMPLHPVALELLREIGPMAQSGASIAGRPAATTIEDAKAQLGDAVAVYLDGGPSENTAPSTIVDLTDDTPRMLREGAVSRDAVAEVLGTVVA
jgi:tRNA threonylcarbamoyl adenosine modification protein (Sua5/YciO/YrdC/YwlC family)